MNIRHRIIIVSLCIALIFAVLEIRLWNIQVFNHTPLKKTALKQFNHSIVINPDRGIIYDRNGQELAVDVNADSVFAVPAEIDNIGRTSALLASVLQLDETEVYRKIKGNSKFTWIKRKIAPHESEKLREVNLEGIYFLKEKKRLYPENELACHVLGCVGIDNQGLSGVERSFDDYLRTGYTKEVKIIDAFGRDIITNEEMSAQKTKNRNVILTIDKYIQHVAELELAKAFHKTGATRATIIVQEPKTGDILAMANLPGFDGNGDIGAVKDRINNPALTDVFEPGSTFKIVTAAAVLEKNLVKPTDRYFCENGVWDYAGYPIRDHEKEGWLNFEQVIMKSSNIGIAKIAGKLGEMGLYEYSRRFGFGNYTGIDLPGESMGIISKPSEWSGISMGRISFGQEVGVTAMQLVGAFSCIANKGMMVQPNIVKCISDPDGNIIKKTGPVVIRRVVSERTVELLTKMLIGAVNEGTGVEAQVKGYTVAGKTGTAQKYDKTLKKYCTKRFTASFAGFLPAYDPRVTILVILDEPDDLYYGGMVAAPVFSKVAQKIMEYYSIPAGDLKLAKSNNNGI